MWKGITAGNKGSPEGGKAIVSYEDFARAGWGMKGEACVTFMQILYFVGVCAGFEVLISQEVSNLLGGTLSVKMVLLCLSPAFAFLSLLPNVTAIAKLTPLAVVAIVAICSIIVVKSSADAQRWQQWPDLDAEELHKAWPESASGLGPVVAIMFGSFSCNANVPSIACEMKDPMQFPLALKSAMGVIATVYLLVMGAGYYGYGEFTQADIVDSLTYFPANEAEAFGTPFHEWTGGKSLVVGYVTSGLLLLKLVIGLPLNLMVVFYSFQTFKYTKDYVPVGGFANKLMRLSVVATTILIGSLVPNFGKLFALVCAVFGPLLQVFLPLFFSFRIRGVRSALWRQCLHGLMLLIAAFTLTFGTYESLMEIVRGS